MIPATLPHNSPRHEKIVLINDLARHVDANRDLINGAIQRVVRSGRFVLGNEIERLEMAFAQYCGAGHCIGVANGTDAIELGLRAIGIQRGDRVATVANAGFYVTSALVTIGAEPVYVDVDRSTHLMDLNHLARALETHEISAVVVTHLYGLMHDMSAALGIANSAGVPVFEDCAQSHGARTLRGGAGSFGLASSFSFYPTKNLGALGDAGAIITSNGEVAAKCRQLRQYGWDSKYRAVAPYGRNSRLDEIQAAILFDKLPFLDGWNDRRRHIATRYSTMIRNERIDCPPPRGSDYVAHLYVVLCSERENLRSHLTKAGISCDVHYPIPDYRQQSFQFRDRPHPLPVTEELSQAVLTLPCFPEMQDEEVDIVIDAINSW